MHTSLTLIHHALALGASTTPTKKKGSSAYSILFLVAIFALVYVFFLRPQRNRQRASAAQRRKADVGDEVTTTSGLIATVIAVEDDFLTLQIAPGVNCRYVPAAILRVNGGDDEPEDTETERDVSTHEVIDVPDADEPSTAQHSDIDEDSNTEPPDVSPDLTDGTTDPTMTDKTATDKTDP
ncbi:MAG TPA: preprotein translocase subunit YajC [Mycobacteriales bacterium]|nr:preprotein translocase subunit YajC [Mycobacteriales bacterium]